MKALLIIVALIGLGTVVATFVIGTGRYERTVVDEPYERGLKWDTERRERDASGWRVRLRTRTLGAGKQDLDVFVSDRSGRALEDAVVDIQFLRPFTTLSGQTFHTVPLPSGRYRLTVDAPEHGRWDMHISVVKGGRRIIFDETVQAD